MLDLLILQLARSSASITGKGRASGIHVRQLLPGSCCLQIDCVKGDTGLKLGLCGIVEAVAGPLQADSGTSGLAAASTAGIETASSCGSSGSRCYSSPDCCSGMLCIRDNYGDSNSPAHCKDDSCFPAHARVVLEGGVVKPVAQLELGDRVLSVDPATGRCVRVARLGVRNNARASPISPYVS